MTGDVLIRRLEYLVALARERHFGRAAQACHVSQPALSAAIRKLEHELDVRIVQRGQRFGGFTPEGQRVVGWAHRILAERDGLRTDLDRMRDGLSATLRIGAIPTAVPATPLITARFAAAHPRARVRIEALSSREIGRRLADFELDVGVTYLDDEASAAMRTAQLYRERFLVLMPADCPLARERVVEWSAAAKLPLCALTPDMRNRRILDAAMARAGSRLEPVMETDNVGALYAHVADRHAAARGIFAAQPRSPRGQARTARAHAGTGADQHEPATHLDGPRLTSLLRQPHLRTTAAALTVGIAVVAWADPRASHPVTCHSLFGSLAGPG